MTRGVRLYLVGSLVLVALAGCGRGFLQFAQREPWRHEAEVQCLKSGAVKEGGGIVRIEPIEGPGICGADFPLKVAALGESAVYGYDDEQLRPPGTVGGSGPRWPIAPASSPEPYAPGRGPAAGSPYGNAAGDVPLSIAPPGAEPPVSEVDEIEPPARYGAPSSSPSRPPSDGFREPPNPGYSRSIESTRYGSSAARSYPGDGTSAATVPLGPTREPQITASVGPVAVRPAATLACPIVSELERWFAEAVQPAAQRWFGQPVVEIKQISAYSCRGMNGQPGAHISEHAFGNALDIAAFTLADGRHISVQTGWHGAPEEQGFLRDVQASACRTFNTVLAPGSNRFHYNHIHVDLMRRASGRRICEPRAVDGESIAARAAGRRGGYAARDDLGVTGSVPVSAGHRRGRASHDDTPDDEPDWVEDE